MTSNPSTIRVVRTDSNFEREKLIRPFGFKGGYLSELWQTVVRLQSESHTAVGLATQSVLYGDADLFAAHSEASGNALMFALTEKALRLVKETPFSDPVDLIDKILPDVLEAGRALTGKPDLNPNFAYNALVSIDNAAWLLYAAEHQISSVEAMIPAAYRPALSYQNSRIAIMYQVPYGMPIAEIEQAVRQGYFVIKIKLGQPGSEAEMLEKDINRLKEIHAALRELETDQTPDGKLIYTLDANGRYRKKESVQRLLDQAAKMGALGQILLFEEPLTESNDEEVGDLNVRVAADESIHNEADAIRRLEQGYGALVLKGIAKTLSLSLKTAQLAHEREVPCMCADLTVNPVLMSWHQNLAARLRPFPGLADTGLMETNGDMNYVNWKTMLSYHPEAEASWMQRKDGVFELGADFYQRSGGIFQLSDHYETMMNTPL